VEMCSLGVPAMIDTLVIVGQGIVVGMARTATGLLSWIAQLPIQWFPWGSGTCAVRQIN